jgi:hypothetical protein
MGTIGGDLGHQPAEFVLQLQILESLANAILCDFSGLSPDFFFGQRLSTLSARSTIQVLRAFRVRCHSEGA